MIWLSCPHRLPCPLRTNPLRLFPLRRKAVHMPHMTAAETAGAASARDLSGYPKPLSPPYPPLSKEIELSRAESAEARSAAFTLSESEIVFEDEWMVVVNKPSGVYCETILSSLKPPQIEGIGHITIPSELHMANRLDRDTSGLMIITKSHKAAAKLVKAFTDHKVKKTYLALCIGHVPNWSRISISSGHGRSKFGAWRVYSASDVDRKLPGGSHVKHMATSFEVLSVNGRGELRQPMVLDMDPVESVVVQDERSIDGGMDPVESVVVQDERSIDGGEELDEVLIRAYPQSGRSHQIRLHCQYLGVPIRGDVKYGGVHQWKGVSCDAHALHSESLSFEHPITGLPIRFHAPLPMWVSERYETALEEF